MCCHCTAQVVPNFRVRTIPVLGTAPAIFGMAAASYILCQLAGSPFDGEPIIQLTGQQYDRALVRLQQREEEVFGNSEGLPVDKDDVSGGFRGGRRQLLFCFMTGAWRGACRRELFALTVLHSMFCANLCEKTVNTGNGGAWHRRMKNKLQL
eukprot:GHRQ01009936.1.p4 GENE.GHRQ01009936.1~~GHRQ01009936.1.p4  ORF type:complete len:152 (-),score=43.28 GHRQ01009936.1:1480-1935(-)